MRFSNPKICFILLLSTAILSTSIFCVASGTWIDSIDAPDIASPGEVVQVDMVVGYSFAEEPVIIPPDDPVKPSGGIPGFPLAAIAVSVGVLSFYLRKKE